MYNYAKFPMQAGFTPLQYAINNSHNEAVKVITNFQAQRLKSAKVDLHTCISTISLHTKCNTSDLDYMISDSE